MPFALSEIGPKESIATLLPVRVSIPIPVIATPYKMKVKRTNSGLKPAWAASEETSNPEKIQIDAKIVIAMTIIAQTELSKPTDMPDRIKVAGPVSADFLISFTGAPCDPV